MPVELLSPPLVGWCGWLCAYQMVARPVAAEQAAIRVRLLLPRNDREYGDRPDNYTLELVLQLEGIAGVFYDHGPRVLWGDCAARCWTSTSA